MVKKIHHKEHKLTPVGKITGNFAKDKIKDIYRLSLITLVITL